MKTIGWVLVVTSGDYTFGFWFDDKEEAEKYRDQRASLGNTQTLVEVYEHEPDGG